MKYSSIWEVINLTSEEKIISLLACNKIVSLNEFVDDFFLKDYFETAKEIENLIEKGYVNPVGKGKFELHDSIQVIDLKFNLRKKIIANISELFLDMNEKKNNLDYNFNLFSDLEKLWGNWIKDDLNIVYQK